MRKVRFVVSCLILAALIYTIPPARGQGLFGTISGEVTDSSGAVVPGATVKVTNVATNVVLPLVTNGAGIYTAENLNPGPYNVQAEAPGFKIAVTKNITLEMGANVKVNLVLQVGSTTQTVEVTATQSAAALQTQETSVSQMVAGQQLVDLPTQSGTGRSVYNLLYLSAGVSQQIGAASGAGGSGGTNNNLMRINGSRPRDIDYILDGSSIEQPVWGGNALNPSTDSVAEFKIESSSSAEYGSSSGGITMIVSKSGTNKFHGSAYGYNGNEHLDARNFFENPAQRKNPFNYNEFGGTIGGPIIRDRLFFFTDYQGIRNTGSSAVTGDVVPDANFRAGNLGELCTAANGANSTFVGGICADPKGQIYYPGTTTPIPLDQITSISPISQNVLQLYPTSSTAGTVAGTDVAAFSSPFNNSLNRFNPRIDYNLSSFDHIFGTFHRETGQSITYGLDIGPAGKIINQTDDYATTIGWSHIFSPTMLNEFRFGYMHRIGNSGTEGQGFTSLADFGINGDPNCLSSIPNTANGTKCGAPAVAISGYAGGTGAVDSFLYEPASTLQFSDKVMKTLGRHSLDIGAEFRRYAINNYQPTFPVGDFSFLGSQTGNAFADFLLGTLSSGSSIQVQSIFLESRAWANALFFQDDFRVTHQLTLNLGLRYQDDNSFHELHHGDAFFNPFTAAWEQFGVNAPSTTLAPWNKEFAPRVGFAWNPKPSWVVRGGYGIMFPGLAGHGKAGDGQASPNLLATTSFPAGTNWSSLPPITNPSPSAITAPIPVNGSTVSFAADWWAPHNQTPTYVQNWNFTVEKQIGASSIAQVAYVGSHGTHLPVNAFFNICQQSPASVAEYGFGATTSPYCSATAAQEVGLASLVVWPGYWGISDSIYHSLQAKYEHRFSHSFSLLVNFTWSKLIDDSSSDWGFGAMDVAGQDFYNRRADRSVSGGDLPLRLTVAPIVELPFGPGKRWARSGLASEVVGGWRVSGIYTVSDGNPFGVYSTSFGFCNAAHTLQDRPDMIGNPRPAGFKPTIGSWFNTQAFDFSGTCPASNLVDLTGPFNPTKAFGNAPRYFSNIRNPGVDNLDFALGKDFRIPLGESTRLKFEADFYNGPNHPQFGPAVADGTSPIFSSIFSTSINNRSIQLGLHLYF